MRTAKAVRYQTVISHLATQMLVLASQTDLTIGLVAPIYQGPYMECEVSHTA